jgi:uracil-DNA glycosylase
MNSISKPLRAELERHLARWQDDLAPEWRPYLADVELHWDAVTPAALLEAGERITPLRKGHTDRAAPKGSHVLRAFDDIPPKKVRAVLLGQDPYPDISRASGLSFQPGDLLRWDASTPPSLRRVLPVLARHRRADVATPPLGAWTKWRAALAQDCSWVGTPQALFARWQREGVLCLNIGLTLSRFDKGNKPVKMPEIQPMHMALWTPLVHRVLHVLVARENQPLLLMLWGGKAQHTVSTALLPPAPTRVFIIDRPHPAARAPRGGLPPFFQPPNPFTEANRRLCGATHDPIDW